MGKQYSLDLNGSEVDEIKLNEHGDILKVSGNDAALFDKFANGYDKIVKMSDEMPGKLEAAEKESADKNDVEKAVAMSIVRVEFCENAIAVIDGIFGEETVKKRYRDYYESIPDFLPDEDLFIEFFETMTPIMEDIFNRKLERQQKASKERMAKYQPQDHKRKGGK